MEGTLTAFFDDPFWVGVFERFDNGRLSVCKGWLDVVIDYHVSQGYGKQNGLSGFDGYIACLEERKKRETAILKALDIESHIIERDMISKKLLEDMLLRSEEA